MTLLEILISSGLLLLMTAVALQVLFPMLDRSARVDRNEENQQRAIVLQELLVQELQEARIHAIYGDRVEYYMPDRLNTPVGNMNIIDIREAVTWNLYDLRILESEVHPDQSVVVQIRVEGANPSKRPLWNLGPGGSFVLDYSATPLLRATVTSVADRTPGAPPWTRDLFVVVEE